MWPPGKITVCNCEGGKNTNLGGQFCCNFEALHGPSITTSRCCGLETVTILKNKQPFLEHPPKEPKTDRQAGSRQTDRIILEYNEDRWIAEIFLDDPSCGTNQEPIENRTSCTTVTSFIRNNFNHKHNPSSSSHTSKIIILIHNG